MLQYIVYMYASRSFLGCFGPLPMGIFYFKQESNLVLLDVVSVEWLLRAFSTLIIMIITVTILFYCKLSVLTRIRKQSTRASREQKEANFFNVPGAWALSSGTSLSCFWAGSVGPPTPKAKAKAKATERERENVLVLFSLLIAENWNQWERNRKKQRDNNFQLLVPDCIVIYIVPAEGASSPNRAALQPGDLYL